MMRDANLSRCCHKRGIDIFATLVHPIILVLELETTLNIRINTALLIEMRTQRAWSQQQLADIAGVSLRTIQRAEKSGRTSADSLQAVASAFNVTPDTLMAISRGRPQLWWGMAWAGLTGLLITIAATLWFSNATAAPLLLKINLSAVDESTESQTESSWDMIVDLDKQSHLDVLENYRLNVLPTLTTDGQLNVSLQLHRIVDGELVPVIQQPGTLVGYNNSYQLTHESTQDGRIQLTVTTLNANDEGI